MKAYCIFGKYFIQQAGTRNGLKEPIIEMSLAANKGMDARNDHIVPVNRYDFTD